MDENTKTSLWIVLIIVLFVLFGVLISGGFDPVGSCFDSSGEYDLENVSFWTCDARSPFDEWVAYDPVVFKLQVWMEE